MKQGCKIKLGKVDQLLWQTGLEPGLPAGIKKWIFRLVAGSAAKGLQAKASDVCAESSDLELQITLKQLFRKWSRPPAHYKMMIDLPTVDVKKPLQEVIQKKFQGWSAIKSLERKARRVLKECSKKPIKMFSLLEYRGDLNYWWTNKVCVICCDMPQSDAAGSVSQNHKKIIRIDTTIERPWWVGVRIW